MNRLDKKLKVMRASGNDVADIADLHSLHDLDKIELAVRLGLDAERNIDDISDTLREAVERLEEISGRVSELFDKLQEIERRIYQVENNDED